MKKIHAYKKDCALFPIYFVCFKDVNHALFLSFVMEVLLYAFSPVKALTWLIKCGFTQSECSHKIGTVKMVTADKLGVPLI